MQRWIALAALLLVLIGGAGVFMYWKYKQSQPERRFVPLTFNADLSEEQRETTVKELRERLLTDVILTGIVRDCDVERKWDLPSEEAAVEELKKRAIVEAGEFRVQGVPTPSLFIGFSGIVSEQKDLDALSERLMADVMRLVGPPQPEPGAEPSPVPTGF